MIDEQQNKNNQDLKTVLVLGGTGNTGRPLIEQLLERGDVNVRAIVRSKARVAQELKDNPKLTLIEGSVLDLEVKELAKHVKGCDAVCQCLGHNMTLKGMFGAPHYLCRDTVSNVCKAVEMNKPESKVKYILMNSNGVAAQDGTDKDIITLGQKVATGALYGLLPPHRDNVKASRYLYKNIGKTNDYVEWTVVRPDNLINDEVSEYEVHPNILTTIFNGKTTTRSNCANFMGKLAIDEELFSKWKFKFPYILNKEQK